MICADDVDTSVVVEAPVEIEGWAQRPWVRLRPLSEAEALERESLGLVEEYELVTGGLAEPAVRVWRSYDLRAMAEYDWAHCVVEGCLPEVTAEGAVVERRIGEAVPGAMNRATTEVLGRMQPALAAWLHEEIERVNRRLPEQRAEIETAKKS